MSSVRTAPLMMQLVRIDAGLRSGSGSNPKRARPANWVEGMSSVLDRGVFFHGITGFSINKGIALGKATLVQSSPPFVVPGDIPLLSQARKRKTNPAFEVNTLLVSALHRAEFHWPIRIPCGGGKSVQQILVRSLSRCPRTRPAQTTGLFCETNTGKNRSR